MDVLGNEIYAVETSSRSEKRYFNPLHSIRRGQHCRHWSMGNSAIFQQLAISDKPRQVLYGHDDAVTCVVVRMEHNQPSRKSISPLVVSPHGLDLSRILSTELNGHLSCMELNSCVAYSYGGQVFWQPVIKSQCLFSFPKLEKGERDLEDCASKVTRWTSVWAGVREEYDQWSSTLATKQVWSWKTPLKGQGNHGEQGECFTSRVIRSLWKNPAINTKSTARPGPKSIAREKIRQEDRAERQRCRPKKELIQRQLLRRKPSSSSSQNQRPSKAAKRTPIPIRPATNASVHNPEQDHLRALAIVDRVPIPVQSNPLVMHLKRGTMGNAKMETLIFDTGSLLTWIHRSVEESSSWTVMRCAECPPGLTFKCTNNNQCKFKVSYMGNHSVTGIMVEDLMELETDDPEQRDARFIKLGAGTGLENFGSLDWTAINGIVGFAQGTLGLVHEFQIRKFAYCLTDRYEGLVYLDRLADTPYLMLGSRELGEWSYNQMRARPDRQYMIQLLSISFNGKNFRPPTYRKSNYVVFDSGTKSTFLINQLYQPIIQEINKYFETDLGYVKTGRGCYAPDGQRQYTPRPRFNPITFHFEGGDFTVKQLNFITMQLHEFYCPELASLEIKDEEGDAIMGIFGYAMQRDHMIVYDLEEYELSFAESSCP
ncbi:hypothetical protein SELMODRAFT_419236 [Selaginella moellendorffii]|uniref:Peptidase A1 domain-containing protein n=1 Tax=Selaginella moellendorffii TaxID=88036 RepID=D8S8A2_SELML|nr:hypothetical protein SELMODRAFT_419236 [Selaginella moellendorffii]